MYQAFDWHSADKTSPSWYSRLLPLLPELRDAGVSMFWLPPPCDAADMHGYLPRKWYNLDSKYGSAADLQRLILSMHEEGIVPMLDVVINHRCASQQDEHHL